MTRGLTDHFFEKLTHAEGLLHSRKEFDCSLWKNPSIAECSLSLTHIFFPWSRAHYKFLCVAMDLLCETEFFSSLAQNLFAQVRPRIENS